MNCCQLLRALHISDDARKCVNGNKSNVPLNSSHVNAVNTINNTVNSEINHIGDEIQCRDISQSQISPITNLTKTTQQTAINMYQTGVLNVAK